MRRRATSTPPCPGDGEGDATPTPTIPHTPTLRSFSLLLIMALVVGTALVVRNEATLSHATRAVRHVKERVMAAALSAAAVNIDSDTADATGLVTKAQLAAHDGVAHPQRPLWIGVIGEVFDVTSGARFYGPDGGYKGFAGKDGSRAFKTGEFTAAGLVGGAVQVESSCPIA